VLLIFGNPPLGTQFITANANAGLDWPVSCSCSRTKKGEVWMAYTVFDWIARRHGIKNRKAQFKMAALLAIAPDLTTFTALRIAQGLCMASAFTLTLAYLGEECSAADAGGAFAAYITGNVASNLIGRLISAALTDHWARHLSRLLLRRRSGRHAILGQIFDRIGWPACVAGIGLALGAAAVRAHRLKLQADPATAMRTA
jgi:MFS family permease